MKYIKRIPLAFQFLFDSEVKLRKKAWIILGLVYLVVPFDLIPEPVLGFGLIDDAVLITYILSKMSEVLDNYKLNKEKTEKEKDIKENIIEDVNYEIKDEDL